MTLKSVDIAANDVFTDNEKAPLIAPLLGRCIDANLTRDLLSRISTYFIDAGYVTTRAYLLEQDVSDGQIEVAILVGEIEAVIDSVSQSSTSYIRSAFLFGGPILNLRELETALEVIERPESVQASFEIRPGSRPGASVIAIDTDVSDPFRLELGSNAQTDLDSQISLRAVLDNPFNINDILEFRGNSGEVRESFQSNRSRQLIYSFALGDYLLSTEYSRIEFDQRLQGINESFISRGETIAESFGLDKLLLRNQFHRLYFGLSLELRDTQNFLQGQLIDVSSYKTSQLRFEFRHLWSQPWGQWSTSYRFDQGLDSFGARDDDYYDLANGSSSEARLQFQKFNLGSRLVYHLARPSWILDMNLQLQHSDDLLFDNDRINLGSPYTVRGYSSALSGSNGWFLHSNVSRQLQSAIDPSSGNSLRKSILLSFGLDYGEVECQIDNPDICGQIYGAGLGLLIEDRNFLGRLSWGHPLKDIGNESGDKSRFLMDFRWSI